MDGVGWDVHNWWLLLSSSLLSLANIDYHHHCNRINKVEGSSFQIGPEICDDGIWIYFPWIILDFVNVNVNLVINVFYISLNFSFKRIPL